MALFKCKMCGGNIEFNPGDAVGTCDSCGSVQTLPKGSDDVINNLFNRANNLRLKSEFDKAAEVYEKILNENNSDAEAHWGLVLCKYGIEYVEDPKTFKRVPTCHRAQYESILTDADYIAAIENSDASQQGIFTQQALEISNIQKGILAIVNEEKPFDVFICYKETDENGKRTVDSALANDIYYQLTQEGMKVFYAAITLENKLGQEYEPYIFAALHSAKVMLVVGTKPEYFEAVWVRNEWSRFLKLMKTDRTKLLIPCYRDMDAYDLPEEFAHLQAQDMSKIGFVNDVVRGIKKVIGEGDNGTAKETVVVASESAASVAPLLKRAFMFLEDGEWAEADEYCEKVLDLDPENAEAYLGKLMAELKIRTKDSLKDAKEPFGNLKSAVKACKFDSAIAEQIKEANIFIHNRNETARKQEIYNKASGEMCNAIFEYEFTSAADKFKSINGFKDASEKAAECLEKAEEARKQEIYNKASGEMCNAIFEYEFTSAADKFKSISGFKDASEKAAECLEKAEEARKDAIYNDAQSTTTYAKSEAEFTSAADKFKSISGFKDADEKAAECLEKAECARKDPVYDNAVAKVSDKSISSNEEAIKLFESIIDWKDSRAKIDECNKNIADIKIAEEKAEAERKRKAEEARIAAEKAKARNKKIAIIGGPIVAALIVFLIVLNTVIIPIQKLNKAMAQLDSGNYDEAYSQLLPSLVKVIL